MPYFTDTTCYATAVEFLKAHQDADVGDLAMARNDDGSSARKMLGTGFPPLV